MDITLENKGPCLRNINVVIPPEEIDEALNAKYAETRKAISLPGFRKGKVPQKLIEKKFGDAILQEVKEGLVQDAFTKAIDDHGLDPVDDPEIDGKSIEIERGTALEFDFSMETRPEFELGEYKGIEIEIPSISVSEEEIEKGLEGLTNRFSSLQDVEDGSAEKGDYLTATVTYSVEGADDVVREECQVNTMLNIVDGVELGEDKSDLFNGKKVGDEVSVEVDALPEHFNPEELRGKAATVVSKIASIKRITPPELDEKFFTMVGVKDLDELKKKVEEGTLVQKEQMRKELIDERIIDKLIETHEFELPQKLLNKQAMRQEMGRKMEMLRMGMDRETVDKRVEEMKERNMKSAERFMQYSFIYDKIAEKEKIFVLENEIDEEYRKIAAARNSTPQEVQAEFEENEMTSSLRARIREDKIRDLLRQKAKTVEKDMDEDASSADASPEDVGSDAESGEASSTAAE